MEKLKSVGQFFVALSLAVLLSVGAIIPAHAVTPEMVVGIAQIAVPIMWDLLRAYNEAENEAEKQAAFDDLMRVWPSVPSSSSSTFTTVKVSADELNAACMELNQAGFPCRIEFNQWVGGYVIRGFDAVYVPGVYESRYIHIRDRVFGTNHGYIYYADHESENTLLGEISSYVFNIYQALTSEDGPFALWMSLLDTDLNLVNINLEQISLKVQSVVDYTNVIANGTVTLVEKMDDLIEAVNGISISADGATINLDTLPIVNKLDEVITAIEDISVNVEGGTFDTLPITNKLDDVIMAIEDISINVEGGTVNFDTVPITDKLDEVIDALHDISVEGAFCDHTFVDSGQYTYRSIFPTTPVRFYDFEADENGWYDFPYIELVPGETYQVYYNGELYQCLARDNEQGGTIYQRSTYIGNQVINDQALGGTYPFSIRNQLVYPTNEIKTTIKPLNEGRPDISISQRVPLSHCSKCGALEDGSDLLQVIGSINSAAATISHAFYKFANFNYLELTYLLDDNHVDLVSKLDVIAENLAPVAPCEHSYMPVVMVESSCDFPGVTKFTCEYCGTFRVELSKPLGHEWEEDDSAPVPLLEDALFGLISGSNPPMLGNNSIITLTPGNTYTVIYEDVEYVTVCSTVDYNGLPLAVIGNIDAFFGTGDNGCPFVIASSEELGGSGCFDFSGATLVTVSIYDGVFPSGHSLRVCTRCHVGVNAAALMEFLDERLVPGSGGSVDVSPVVDKLTSIENALSNLGGDVNIENNTNIEVSEDNDNYNIFYVDDPDGGDDQSIVDLSGDALKVFGKLLNFLYQVGFKDALDGAGPGIGDLSDFYLDNAEGSADLWVS